MLKIAKVEKQYRVELFQVNKLNTLFSELVRQQLIELVEEPGVSVIFNLEGIRFIDSAGFGVLMEVSALAREKGSELLLCNITDEVRELVNLMELENRFTFATCENSREKILVALD